MAYGLGFLHNTWQARPDSQVCAFAPVGPLGAATITLRNMQGMCSSLFFSVTNPNGNFAFFLLSIFCVDFSWLQVLPEVRLEPVPRSQSP